MMKQLLTLLFLVLMAPISAHARPLPLDSFMVMLAGSNSEQEQVLKKMKREWDVAYTPFLLEIAFFDRYSRVTDKVFELLEQQTGKRFGHDFDAWYQWLWNQKYTSHPDYATFKSQLYGGIDPPFAGYFAKERKTTIRLDEVRWGGVRQDGIPPLRYPEMLDIAEADYLEDDNVVFGISINGDTRAYPKRILAWHEMFVDEVGGESVTGVYCTLCGAVILYKNKVGKTTYQLGTSGFLYRSNKLMYDQMTQSLWNSLTGRPVIGPLVDKDIRLARGSVVTTTWGEWKRRHPSTTVLSLDTGHVRDYREGAAYRKYFASDKLMFTIPKFDKRLKNKDEVLGLVFEDRDDPPLAIFSGFLEANPIYEDTVNKKKIVVLTDASGANRVYQRGPHHFTAWDQDMQVIDSNGKKWSLHEGYLKSQTGEKLMRLPAHRAFWFGWYSMFNNTRLVQ